MLIFLCIVCGHTKQEVTQWLTNGNVIERHSEIRGSEN